MTMHDDRLFFSLCRISATQILQSSGFDKSRPSVIDAFTDILIRYIDLLGSTAKMFAEAAGRSRVHLEDLRAAFEHVDDSKDGGVDEFIRWCKGGEAEEARRVSGVGQDEGELPSTFSSNNCWLRVLMSKQTEVGGKERFEGTVLSRLRN